MDSQISALRQFCAENGYEEIGLYNDAGISARKSYKKRPALLRLMADCQTGKVDLILFTKLDRWFRSVADYYEVQKILDSCDVPWRAIWEDYETETSSGVFKVNIMLSVAQSEADRTSERIRAVNDFRRERGEYVGRPPVGYVTRDRGLFINEEERAGVQAFFKAYLDYRPIKECCLAAGAEGVTIRRNTAYKMLASETYAGRTQQGYNCDPYITHEEYLAIQSRKMDMVRTGHQHTYLFHGICRCGYCGRMLAASARRRYSVRRGEYYQIVYQCRNTVGDYVNPPCKGCGINEEILEEILLDQLAPSLDAYRVRLEAVKMSGDKDTAEAKKRLLEAKLKRVAEMYEDGVIQRDEYKEKKDAIMKELSSIVEPEAVPDISLPDDWRLVYNGMDMEGKRLFWRRILKKVVLYKDRKAEMVFG